ncbi:MAG TPA: cytochrome c, partial [Gemmatimonadales bacterium]|nr:cytochrome c [Gemmatimonadales bacterium]
SVRRRPWAAIVVLLIVSTIVIFWIAGERAPWSPDFGAKPLAADVVRDTRPNVVEGARLFYTKGCEFCHAIGGQGGVRGPDLTLVATRMSPLEMVARITNGSPNMPAFTSTLTPDEIQAIVAFLATRK